MTATAEQAFIAGTSELRWQSGDLQNELRQLDDWLARVAAEYSAAPLRHTGLLPGHALAEKAVDLNRQLAGRAPAWLQQHKDLEAAQTVAGALDQRAIFLVFGKFNAGKSSLCNFIADRFLAHGEQVEYFRIEAGRIVTTGQRFKEGATETTTALQGVFLGRKLVLLDTPGLHSVTPENAELTQRFTDSADGVLWLTSSTSPGQVQELDELARELRRAKPLLPVVSRSDYLEEDEIDGEIFKVLCNKSAATRQLQQTDVLARGREKLGLMGVDQGLLQAPVSVSVYAAHRQANTDAAMREAGFEAFWSAFAAIVEPALEYKQRKYAEIVLHHGEESVMHDLRQAIVPQLDVLLKLAADEKSSLESRQEMLKKRVWRTVVPALPEILERHAAASDAEAVCEETGRLFAESFRHEARRALDGHAVADGADPLVIELNDVDGYERLEMAADAGGLALCSHERLNAALEQSVHAALDRAARKIIDQCHRSIGLFASSVDGLKAGIHEYQVELTAIKNRVRHPGTETKNN